MNPIYTIGHSTHELEAFIKLLKLHTIRVVADVRSQPYSSRFPQYNREALKQSLKDNEISYSFLGQELGARRHEDCCYVDGQAQYELIAKTESFVSGIERLKWGMTRYRIALLCSEKDPLTCHRTILVCKHLKTNWWAEIHHILADGSLESHAALEARMVKGLGTVRYPVNWSPEQILEDAYVRQGRKIAYRKKF